MKLSIYFSWFFWRGEGRARGLLWLRTGGERKINFLLGHDGDSAVLGARCRPGCYKTRRIQNSPFGLQKLLSPKNILLTF